MKCFQNFRIPWTTEKLYKGFIKRYASSYLCSIKMLTFVGYSKLSNKTVNAFGGISKVQNVLSQLTYSQMCIYTGVSRGSR